MLCYPPQTSHWTCITYPFNTSKMFFNEKLDPGTMPVFFAWNIVPKMVGVFTPTTSNLSKHSGFQAIHSCTTKTRQTRPGVMLSQQQMSDLKGKREFAGEYCTFARLWVNLGFNCGLQATILLIQGRSYIFYLTATILPCSLTTLTLPVLCYLHAIRNALFKTDNWQKDACCKKLNPWERKWLSPYQRFKVWWFTQ